MGQIEKKKHDWKKENYEEYRKKITRECQKRRREKAKAQGKCIICCREQADQGKTTCKSCRNRVIRKATMGTEVRVPPNRWNIIQRIIRDYPVMRKELEEIKGRSRYRERLIRETAAVSEALTLFSEAEREVIRERFWTYRDKNKGYEDMFDQPYSPRQMRRIVYKMVIEAGKRLGEIRENS